MPQLQDIHFCIMRETVACLPVDQPNGRPPAPSTLVLDHRWLSDKQ